MVSKGPPRPCAMSLVLLSLHLPLLTSFSFTSAPASAGTRYHVGGSAGRTRVQQYKRPPPSQTIFCAGPIRVRGPACETALLHSFALARLRTVRPTAALCAANTNEPDWQQTSNDEGGRDENLFDYPQSRTPRLRSSRPKGERRADTARERRYRGGTSKNERGGQKLAGGNVPACRVRDAPSRTKGADGGTEKQQAQLQDKDHSSSKILGGSKASEGTVAARDSKVWIQPAQRAEVAVGLCVRVPADKYLCGRAVGTACRLGVCMCLCLCFCLCTLCLGLCHMCLLYALCDNMAIGTHGQDPGNVSA